MNSRILVPVLLGILGGAGCSKEPGMAPAPPAAIVNADRVSYPPNAPQLAYITVRPAVARRLAVTHLTGRLYLSDDTTVRVFTPVAGQVTAVKADVGDRVATGAGLADISSPDYGQALADARAGEANRIAAEKALERTKDLLAHGAAAQKELESAEAVFEAAEAERDRASARLSLYHGDSSATGEVYALCAPSAGVVVERNINEGQEVRADQMLANATNLFAPLFVISDPSRLWVQIDAAETDLDTLQAGQRIQVTTQAFPGRVFQGTLDSIAPTLDPTTRTLRVRGTVENPDGILKAEMYVTVDVVRNASQMGDAGVEIPSTAVFTVEGKSYLFVQTAPGQFERREVQIGSEQDGRLPVTSGLNTGDPVVTEGALLLQSVLNPAD